MIDDPDHLSHKDAAIIFAKAMNIFLKENEGVVIKYEGLTFAVNKAKDGDGAVVGIQHDPDLEGYEEGQLLWLTDGEEGPVGNA